MKVIAVIRERLSSLFSILEKINDKRISFQEKIPWFIWIPFTLIAIIALFIIGAVLLPLSVIVLYLFGWYAIAFIIIKYLINLKKNLKALKKNLKASIRNYFYLFGLTEWFWFIVISGILIALLVFKPFELLMIFIVFVPFYFGISETQK